jgi:hypothetical protein
MVLRMAALRSKIPMTVSTRSAALGHFDEASVAIDGRKFKADNNRDKNITRAKMQRRRLLSVGTVELVQIACNALLDLRHTAA